MLNSILISLQLLIALSAFFGFLVCVSLLRIIWFDKEFLDEYREQRRVKRERWENIKKAYLRK